MGIPILYHDFDSADLFCKRLLFDDECKELELRFFLSIRFSGELRKLGDQIKIWKM